ncbi:MAG: glucokinase [Planctomycetes bacterium]|nr:glucokinase [Planctomycetota bacterium]
MILAADLGGTKSLLGLFRMVAGKPSAEREQTFDSSAFSSFETMAGEFLSGERRKPRRVAIGVAAPVSRGVSQAVNLQWTVSARRVATRLAVEDVLLLNDLEATAWGIPSLSPRKLVNLTPGLRPGKGNAAVLAAGTGLGMATVVRDGERWLPQPSEGGHQDFGPRDDLEIALLRYMRRRQRGRVSLDRLVSGPGLVAIYDFLVDNGWGRPSTRMRTHPADVSDRAAAIGAAGLAEEDPVASRAVDLLVSLYGAAAGNLALAARATGGVYVGGGIAPRLLPRLRAGGFVAAFRDKGRLSDLLHKICIRVIVEPRTALIGAAAAAFAPRPAVRQRRAPRRRAKSK